ncbi:hypothetical protein B0H11DRAFT_1928292 [Mycena galericulata]|nr:hypothetical protein B0H11DRAFT_1928292 [Mycena galericulata]
MSSFGKYGVGMGFDSRVPESSGRNLESDSGPPGMIFRPKSVSAREDIRQLAQRGQLRSGTSRGRRITRRSSVRTWKPLHSSGFHASPGSSGKEVDSLVDKFDYSTVMESAPLAMACRPHFVLVSSERYIIQVGGGSGFDSRDTWIVVQWLKILSRQEYRNCAGGAPTSFNKTGKERPRRLVGIFDNTSLKKEETPREKHTAGALASCTTRRGEAGHERNAGGSSTN